VRDFLKNRVLGRSFLRNHAGQITAIDFFTVPTVTFNVLYGFVVLLHDRRHVVHFNMTAHPYSLLDRTADD
jgi:putative transposase